MHSRRIFASLALFVTAGLAAAQTGPQLATFFPPGAKTGETIEVILTGTGFDGEEELFFSEKGFKSERIGAATVDPKAPKGQANSSVKFKVTAPSRPGTCDVRVISKSGLSNPRAFTVGNLVEARESEPNNDVAQAQKIALDTTVNGAISSPTDVDYVRFQAKAGQNVVVYCLTTSIDSRLTADILAVAADGKRLAENRNYRGGDAVLDFQAPADGEYLVRVAQFAYTTGGSDHFYRLTVTTKPWVDAVWPPLAGTGKGWHEFGRNGGNSGGGEPFLRPDGRPYDVMRVMDHVQFRQYQLETSRGLPPSAGMLDAIDGRGSDGNLLIHSLDSAVLDNGKNQTTEAAQEVKPPCDVAGRIARKNDRHWYSFDAKKGEVWTLEVFAERIGSPIDAFFRITDATGRVITEADDGPPTLSPNQFFTTTDDPARYRFVVPNDGTYRVMVSSRDAGTQFGVRAQYVLRIAKENPDFRFAVMPVVAHLPDAGTIAKGSAVLYNVYVFRMDGFNDAIELEASNLPPGIICPPQTIPAGQTRGTLVIQADKNAREWEGFATITGVSGKLRREARPFTIIWPIPNVQPNQPVNTPALARMDRGPGLALAVRGSAPFSLAAIERELKGAPGGKIEVTLKIDRDARFKDPIQVFSATPNFGPRQQGNNPPQPITTIAADKSEAKISIDVQTNTPAGVYTLILRGQSGAPQPKGPMARPVASFPAQPITVVVGKR